MPSPVDVAAKLVGADGADAAVVVAFTTLVSMLPELATVWILKLYAVPAVSPVTLTGLVSVVPADHSVQVAAELTLKYTLWPVTADPVESVHATDAEFTDGVTANPVAAAGRVVKLLAVDAGEQPCVLQTLICAV